MQSFNAPSAAVAGPEPASRQSSGATLPLSPFLPQSFSMESEGPLAGTPAAAPGTASAMARTVTSNAPTCMSAAHAFASAAQHCAFVSLSSAATSHAASTSPTLPPRRPRKLALASAHMLALPHGSHGNGSGSGEDLLSEHTATPPTPSPALDADASRLCDMHSFPGDEPRPSNDPAHGGFEPHHRRMHALPRLSEGALSAPAESRTANPLPSAPRQADVGAISDAEDAAVRAYTMSVSATAATLASTRSPARRASVPPPPPAPAFETPAVSTSPPLTKDNQDNLSPSYSCSVSIPSPSPAFSPFTHQPSLPLSPAIAACCPARGTEQKAVQRHQSQSAPPRTVVHKLLSAGCTAEPDMPVVLPAARRRSSYVSGSTMLGSFCLTEDGVESSDGGATATVDTPLMRSNTSRATTFSGAAAAAAMTTASATPYTSPSPTAAQRFRSASALMRYASTFSTKDDSSVNASATAEAALLSTPSQSPPRPPCALSTAMASEMQSGRDKDNGEVTATAPAVAVTSAMPSTYRLLTAPATGARSEDLSWLLPSFSDGNAQISLAAAPQRLHSCLATECDRAMRAMQRQELWAEQTAAGREELRRQVEGHVVAKYHNRSEGLCKDASAWRLPQEAPCPEQQLLSDKAVLVLDDGRSSARSAAAKTIAVAGDAPPSLALFPRLISTSLSCMGLRRGTATQPEVHASTSTRSKPAEDEQDAVAVGSPVENEDLEDSAIFEKSGLAESQRRPSGSEAAASVPLPPGAPRSRASVSFLGSSLSYEAALLSAAQEMSG
ncbi:hypothetical protein, unknown function [Leishmania donovani]|uniref:Uncharacterized protein n=1 Tax=Leishmania donovani TaxID=5661 RepID=E9BB22_LEIDO|nr:hypothetical protein, unknown function [Leishmania donovani]CBZ32447.1 hypothetical protein, unknown function [Leishmania donovani]